MALMELGRWDEAAQRLIEALDSDPSSPELSALAARLIREHPQPSELETELLDRLRFSEGEREEGTLRPLSG